MAEEHEGEVTFIGVSNNDTVEDGKSYASEYDVPYGLAHAPEVWDLYDVPYQPVTIVIGADGVPVEGGRIDGPITEESLAAVIDRAL